MATLDDVLRLNKQGNQTDAFGQSFSAGSEFIHGLQARDAAEFQAQQLRINADNALASSQRVAEDSDRQAQIIKSRALAVAAASGGGASDPGVVSIMARNAEEMAYRRQAALYEGLDRARSLNLAADTRVYEGKAAAVNSAINAAGKIYGASTTLMKGQAREASLKQRFGMGAPAGIAMDLD